MFYLLLEKGVFLLRFYYTPNHAGQQDEAVFLKLGKFLLHILASKYCLLLSDRV